jgi:CdiI N-terminal domain
MNLAMKVINTIPEIINNIPSVWGRITINDFTERFIMPLEYWSIENYEKQWREGLDKIKIQDKSCLVASVQDPKKAPWINWWVLYKKERTVFIRNQILFSKLYKAQIGDGLFTPDTCYDYIHERRSKQGVSEWKVDLD